MEKKEQKPTDKKVATVFEESTAPHQRIEN